MKDLTILIQGPYFEIENYNSNLNIKKLKEKFPESKILVSTWVNENRYKVKSDEIIYNEDPGIVLDEHVGSATKGSNIQRQITSVINGLAKIKTKYCLKIRSDCYFDSNKILNIPTNHYQREKKFQLFEERILISTIGSFNQSNTSILYHYSDWFNYGLTKDLKKLWGEIKIDNRHVNFYKRYPFLKKNILGKDWDLRFTAEQLIYYKDDFIKNKIEHGHDFSKEKLDDANNYLINNFFLVDPDKINFVFPKYDGHINKKLTKKDTNIRNKSLISISYNEKEWHRLYNKINNVRKFLLPDIITIIFNKKLKIKQIKYSLILWLKNNLVTNYWNYYRYNKKKFLKKNNEKESVVLVEYNSLCDSHIIYSYLANYLAKIDNSKIYSFYPKFFDNIFSKFKFFFKKKLLLSYHVIYESFGVQVHIFPKNKRLEKVKKITQEIFDNLKNKDDINKITYKDVHLGDLIYDGYLRKNNFPTIYIKSEKFKKYLNNFLDLADFWIDFFYKNNVSAIISSHTVYEFGIVVRIAKKNNIKVYTAGSFFILCNNIDSTILEMKYYSKEFRKLDIIKQKLALNQAKYWLEKKFSGEKTIENKVSCLPTDSPFKNKSFKNRILQINNKKKVLIAAHHFSDAPHAYGLQIFSDYYEWIEFLGKKSESSDYDWYIKFHPMEFLENKKTAEYFLQKYSKIKLINKDVLHGQIISEGINLVLTVYGTIGLEYAYFGIPVINAGLNNPHCNYNFNYNARNIADYEDAIDNFDKLELNYDKNQFYEYFYMRYLHNFYLFKDEINNDFYDVDYQSPHIYGKWLRQIINNNEIEDKLQSHIEKFVDSKEFRCINYI
jgi:hypothetical protein